MSNLSQYWLPEDLAEALRKLTPAERLAAYEELRKALNLE